MDRLSKLSIKVGVVGFMSGVSLLFLSSVSQMVVVLDSMIAALREPWSELLVGGRGG